MNAIDKDVRFIYCDMIHNGYDYKMFNCHHSSHHIDIGNMVMKTELAKDFELKTNKIDADGMFCNDYINKHCKKEENIKKNQRVGLMCYCELRTTLREVKKDGLNKGKLFYCCSKSYNNDDKCDYFMWKDESDRRINKNIQINFEEQKEQIEENNESNEMICYCNLPAIQLIVKKDGPNNGRKFYKCSKYNDDKCKYFKWEDEI